MFQYSNVLKMGKKEYYGGLKIITFKTIEELRPLFSNKIDHPLDATLVPDRIIRILIMADLWCLERTKKNKTKAMKNEKKKKEPPEGVTTKSIFLLYTMLITNWRPGSFSTEASFFFCNKIAYCFRWTFKTFCIKFVKIIQSSEVRYLRRTFDVRYSHLGLQLTKRMIPE